MAASSGDVAEQEPEHSESRTLEPLEQEPLPEPADFGAPEHTSIAEPPPGKNLTSQIAESPPGEDWTSRSEEPPPGEHSTSRTMINLFLYGAKVPPNGKQDFSKARKGLILAIVAFGAFLVPLGTGIYLPMLLDIQTDLDTSAMLVNLSLTLYLLALAIGPLGWGTLADTWGRRPVYLISLTVFIAGCVGCGLSPNIGVLLFCRVLQGLGGSSVLSVGAGTISDVFLIGERARAFSAFYLGPLAGPAIAPPIGGLLAEYATWRWTFALLAACGLIVTLCIAFFLPETLDLTPGAKAKRQRPNPFRAITYLKYSFVSIAVLVAVLLMFSVFSYISNYSRELQQAYPGITSAQVGLLYLPHTIANIPGNIVAGFLADWAIRQSRKQGGPGIPEWRLRVTLPGFVGFPVGITLMAWGLYKALPIYVICIAGALIGFNQFIVLTPLQTFLVDIFPKDSASIISLYNLGRYLVAAVAPIVVIQATEAMHAWWLTMWAALVACCGVAVGYLGLRGYQWRTRYELWAPKASDGPADREEAVEVKAGAAPTDAAVQAVAKESDRDVA